MVLQICDYVSGWLNQANRHLSAPQTFLWWEHFKFFYSTFPCLPSVVAAMLCSAYQNSLSYLDFVPSDQHPPIALSFLPSPGDCHLVLLLVQQLWLHMSEAVLYWSLVTGFTSGSPGSSCCHCDMVSFLLFTLIVSHCSYVSCFLFTSVHLRWFPFCGCCEHSWRIQGTHVFL